MDENKIKDWVKELIDNSSHQATATKNLLESVKVLNAEIELLNRRIDRLEQKSSISYLKPLDPRDGGL